MQPVQFTDSCIVSWLHIVMQQIKSRNVDKAKNAIVWKGLCMVRVPNNNNLAPICGCYQYGDCLHNHEQRWQLPTLAVSTVLVSKLD